MASDEDRLAELRARLSVLYGPEGFSAWMVTHDQRLKSTPAEAIADGRLDEVMLAALSHP